MDLQAAERLANGADPNAIMALQKQSGDPAVAKAVAEQFGTLLMERALQHADGTAIAMTDGVGANVVNAMFAGTIAQTAMSGDRLGLADLLFRSMAAKQSAAGGGAAAASPAAAPSAAAPPAPPITASAAAGSGLPLSPYWQDHGLRPLGGGVAHPAPVARGSGTATAIATPARTAAPAPSSAGAAAAAPIAVSALPPMAPAASPAETPASGGGPATDGTSTAQMTAFAGRLGPLLERAAKQIGVSARVLLAQAALETGWGRSVVGNNVFGIKAGPSWPGAKVTTATHEVENGRSVPQTAAFRAYGSLADAVRDFVSVVGGSSRYHAALGAGDDARFYAEALIKGGYATDGDYPAKLAAVAASPAIEAAFTGPIPLLPPNFANSESRSS